MLALQLGKLCGLARCLRFKCSFKCGFSRGMIGSLLGGQFSRLPLCLSLLCRLLCRLLRCVLCSQLHRLLPGPFCLAILIFKPAGFGGSLHIGGAFRLRLSLQARLFFFNCLLHALARLLAGLRSRL